MGSPCDTLSIGINELAHNKNKLNAYPNPASYLITINAQHVKGKSAAIRVFNLVGEMVWQKQVMVYNGGYVTQDIYLDGFSKGVYIVQMQTETSVMAVKFVKE